MGFARGRYGVEYHPHEDGERKRVKTVLPLVAAAALISICIYQIRGCLSREGSSPKRMPTAVEQTPPLPLGTEAESSPAKPDAVPPTAEKKRKAPEHAADKTLARSPLPPAVHPFAKWLDTPRPHDERVLLERFVEAERQQNLPMAIQTLEKLHDRPSMADLQDPLKRRLGDLNIHRLLTEKATPWTAFVTVRRGDSLTRVARDRRMTAAALAKLNPSVDWSKLQPGMTLRVLDYPNAVLVVHRKLNIADLSLKNGKFFRRYYGSVSAKAECKVYPVSSENGCTLHARFRDLGLRFAPADREELKMLLAPGSRIIVAEP